MSTESTTPAEVGSNDQLGLPAETLNCWRINYGLTKTPNELHALWRDGAPPGAVLALRAAVLEIERLNSVARGNFEAAVDALDGCRIDVEAARAAERERCAMRLEQAAAEYIATATDSKYLTDHGRALMTSASDWAQTMAQALRALEPNARVQAGPTAARPGAAK